MLMFAILNRWLLYGSCVATSCTINCNHTLYVHTLSSIRCMFECFCSRVYHNYILHVLLRLLPCMWWFGKASSMGFVRSHNHHWNSSVGNMMSDHVQPKYELVYKMSNQVKEKKLNSHIFSQLELSFWSVIKMFKWIELQGLVDKALALAWSSCSDYAITVSVQCVAWSSDSDYAVAGTHLLNVQYVILWLFDKSDQLLCR